VHALLFFSLSQHSPQCCRLCNLLLVVVHVSGGGCGVGAGLGWGWGAAWGSKYIIVDAEFETSKSDSTKPHWLAQLQQQLRIQKYEKSHHQQ
jgi:hypothetical protein